ncbi:MAG TPA: hypothetical protein GX714_11135 [Chloroflexi bacterium]|nr:hypothetical protein [Chloroflexota bacterium]
MAGVRTLQTLTESFWRDEYVVSAADLDLVTGQILEAARPQRLGALASTIILRRMQAEREAVTRQAKQGDLYQPKGHYEVGQTVVFSALDFQSGRVVGLRAGENPKYGPFNVIRVAFDDPPVEREFAADLDVPHPLNVPVEELVVSTDSAVSEADLVRAFEHYVAVKLEPVLEEAPEFVRFDGQWFLRDLLPEIHVGHLNLAEAMIDEAGHPLPAREMIAELELPVTGSREAQLFALNRALGEDSRFDNVSTADDRVWFLRALVPEAVYERPAVLEPAFRAQGGEYIGLTMLDMVEEIGDELDDVDAAAVLRDSGSVRFELSFPHLYAGTMPATQSLLRMMPPSTQRYYPITLVDARGKKRFDAWVVPEERYVCGLKEWYTETGLTVGAEVTLASADEPLTFTISVAPVRSRRRDWIRVATVAEGDFSIQLQQQAPPPVRADQHMLMLVPDEEAIVGLMRQAAEAQLSLSAMVRSTFLELAKLGGTVHAKSLYSACNMLRRTGAVPVFAELTRRACYNPVGDGLWVYSPDLEGTVYRDPDEMRERPLSNREDTVRDQAIQYLGR